jgi:predicted kinase
MASAAVNASEKAKAAERAAAKDSKIEAFKAAAKADTRLELPQNFPRPSKPRPANFNKPHIYMLRGVQGSGKTTLAKALVKHCESLGYSTVICSADDFFTDAKGNYKFDGARINEAHTWCQARFDAAVSAKTDIVIVDNTNLKSEHMDNYKDRSGAYTTILVVFDCANEAIAQAFRRRSKVCYDITPEKTKALWQTFFLGGGTTTAARTVHIPPRGIDFDHDLR